MPQTYETIATTTLGSSANSFTFSGIPSTYTDLRIVISGINAGTQSKRIGFNGDTTVSSTNYGFVRLNSNGSAPGSQMTRSGDNYGIRFASDQFGDSTSVPAHSIIDIFSYTSTTWYKEVLFQTFMQYAGGGYVQRTAGYWNSTAAITSVTFLHATDTWSAGTTATVYGLKAA